MGQALLIVDAQVNMFDEDAPPRQPAELLDRLVSLRERARVAGLPIVYVQHCGGPGDIDEPGAPGWAIHPALTPRAGESVVQKQSPDAFAATELQRVLADQGVDSLIVCGLQSELCIDATVRRAAELGYAVTLAADAHGTFDGGDQSAAQIIDAQNHALAAVATLAPAAALP